VPWTARADDDALAPYRERFRSGMESYKAGALGEAIRVWRAIYEEIGPSRGYRLSFNLARAYDVNGEATRAAERYESFLEEAKARAASRDPSEPTEPLVAREMREAAERLEALKREHGRIEIPATAVAVLTKVDDTDPRLGAFTAYVAPGAHVVTFGPGQPSAEKVDVSVAAGEVVVARTAPSRPVAPPPALDPVIPPPRTARVPRPRPFSPIILYAGGVATAVAVIAPALAYSNAYSLANTYNTSPSPATRNSALTQYFAARDLYYGLLAVPIGLAAATGGLTAWYLAAPREREVTLPLTVGLAPLPGGGAVRVEGRF
jgi:hypothetical protein